MQIRPAQRYDTLLKRQWGTNKKTEKKKKISSITTKTKLERGEKMLNYQSQLVKATGGKNEWIGSTKTEVGMEKQKKRRHSVHNETK